MCGTCKFCLGFFQFAAVFSFALMVNVTSIFYLYGGMPPVYSMHIGFWIQYFVGWTSIYLTFYIVRVLGKGMFTPWTPKYCFAIMVIIIFCYLTSSICFFVPVTVDRMVVFSQNYNASKQRIPPFLAKFQEQYQCCGIRNYKDYNDPTVFGTDAPLTRKIDVNLGPDNPEFYMPAFNDQGEPIAPPPPGTKLKLQYYFNVDQTCCTFGQRVKFKECNLFVPYLPEEYSSPDKYSQAPAETQDMLNSVTSGCFEKYQTLMENSIFQLNWLIGIMRVGSLLQAFFYFFLIWVYRLSLRAMRRNMEGQISMDDGDSGILPFVGILGGKSSSEELAETLMLNREEEGGLAAAGSRESLGDVIKDFISETGKKQSLLKSKTAGGKDAKKNISFLKGTKDKK